MPPRIRGRALCICRLKTVSAEAFVHEGGDASLGNVVGQLIARYLGEVDGAKIDRLRFESFWIVSQFEGTPSPVHFHSGDISGVLYLKVPEIADPDFEVRLECARSVARIVQAKPGLTPSKSWT